MTKPAPATNQVDVAVIGLGSAGEAASRALAESGLDVVGFEPHLVGGECPFTACMPSKSLLHDAHQPGPTRRSWVDAIARRDEIVDHLDDSGHHDGLSSAGVSIVRASARLTAPRTVSADGKTWVADHVIIATGSSPTIPPIDGLDEIDAWTAFDALTNDELPRRLVVLGGGAIGSELSSVYASYGTEVTLIERSDVLFPDVDRQVGELFESHLRARGVNILLGRSVTAVASAGGSISIEMEQGGPVVADRLLLAVGQTPRLDGLGLESIGIDPADIGNVGESGRVGDLDWLSAIGDVNGESPWTHGANREARAVVQTITEASHRSGRHMRAPMPRCVFTSPPLAHVGTGADDHGPDAVRGVASYSDIARTATDELPEGAGVLVVDRPSRKIVGFSAVGAAADEIVATAAALIHMEASIEQARDLVFSFPTISQLLEAAIEDAHTKLT